MIRLEFSVYCVILSILQNRLYRIEVEPFCCPFMVPLTFFLADQCIDENSMVFM